MRNEFTKKGLSRLLTALLGILSTLSVANAGWVTPITETFKLDSNLFGSDPVVLKICTGPGIRPAVEGIQGQAGIYSISTHTYKGDERVEKQLVKGETIISFLDQFNGDEQYCNEFTYPSIKGISRNFLNLVMTEENIALRTYSFTVFSKNDPSRFNQQNYKLGLGEQFPKITHGVTDILLFFYY